MLYWETKKFASCLKTAILRLSILLIFTLTALQAAAQDINILNKGKGQPLVLQLFDPAKNETTVIVSPGAAESVKMLGLPTMDALRLANRELILWDAHYNYAGKTPTRPESVKFTFYVNQRKDRYQKNTSFFVKADGKDVQQRDFVFEQRTLEDNKKPVSQDIIIVEIPTGIFLSIVQAKKVQIKVGPEAYTLNGDQRKHLSALAKTLEMLSK